MREYVAFTDKRWFEQVKVLSRLGHVDEVNF